MKVPFGLSKTFTRLRKEVLGFGGIYLLVNLSLILIQFTYLNLRYEYLIDRVPLFYTFSWGRDQLVTRADLFIIPALSLGITLAGLLFLYYFSTRHYKFGAQLLFFVSLFTNSFLTYSLFRSIRIGLVTDSPLISVELLGFLIPSLIAFFASLVLSIPFSKLMHRWGIVTDPAVHEHPGMLLKKPSARGGGFFFTLIFCLLVLVFVPLDNQIIGVLVISILLSIVGLLDDYQNTHPGSKLSFLEIPSIRLALLFLLVGILYFFGVQISFLISPFDGAIDLSIIDFSIGGLLIQPISWLLTTLWVVWLLNLLSWSNGVDGQYSGITGVAFITLGLLGLRLELAQGAQINYSLVLFIAAGVSLGLTGATWSPSKMMWGFGAVSAGLVLASMSILVQAKIITSILILLVPFLDAVAALIRRLSSGKSPLKGDKEHLHHVLLDKGFSVPQVALFYWVIAMLFGALSLLTVDNTMLQTILTAAGVLLFLIILTNLRLSIKKLPPQKVE